MEELWKGALAPQTDVRDYKVCAAAGEEFPARFELLNLPRVKNQGSVNSCVAHATATILEYFNRKEIKDNRQLSTDFIYGMQGVAYNRLDQGMFLRDACKIALNYGDCYDVTIPSNTEQPRCSKMLKEILTDDIYTEARSMRIASYAQCASNKAMKHALMNYGPLLVSIKWYDKYKLDDNKVITFDTKKDWGGHAVIVYGWNEHGWLCQNSWGRTWEGNGKFVFPYDNKFREAWSFVDAENSDVIKPRRGKFIDFCYKIINTIINFFKGRK